MYGLTTWCPNPISFYPLQPDPSSNGYIQPMTTSGLRRSHAGIFSPSSFRRLIGGERIAGGGGGEGGGGSFCSTLPDGAIYGFPVRGDDHMYAPVPSFPPVFGRALLLSDRSAPTYSMFDQVFSSQLTSRRLTDEGQLTTSEERTKASSSNSSRDQTMTYEEEQCRSTADNKNRRSLKAKRQNDVIRQVVQPPSPQSLSSSSSSSASRPQSLKQKMFWSPLPLHRQPSPPSSRCSRLNDDDESSSSSSDKEDGADDDGDNNDDIIIDNREADETKDDDSGTIKKDTIERNGDIICPVCKNILKRCQLESHLKKEMEQLVYTQDNVSSSTPASTDVDSTTNPSSLCQIHVCRRRSCSSCKKNWIKMSSKLRYDAFLKVRSNRQSRLAQLRLCYKSRQKNEQRKSISE